jgi:predicted esterase
VPRRATTVPATLFALVLALLCALAPGAQAAPADAPASPTASFDPSAAFVHVPASVRESSRPVQVVFAFHGMGGEGAGFAQAIVGEADRAGWVVVAPTFSYGNWRDPAAVANDDIALTRALVEMLDRLPERLGRPVEPRAIVLGFSRGAQLAHRFAETYPDRTRAAIVCSAGTYTVPAASDARGTPLPFPFGTADLVARSGHPVEAGALAAVQFWVAVGARDNNPADVPRQWDALVGTNRVERAGTFVRLLKSAGVTASLTVFPNTGHELSAEMVRGAAAFLRQATAAPAPSLPAAVDQVPSAPTALGGALIAPAPSAPIAPTPLLRPTLLRRVLTPLAI